MTRNIVIFQLIFSYTPFLHFFFYLVKTFVDPYQKHSRLLHQTQTQQFLQKRYCLRTKKNQFLICSFFVHILLQLCPPLPPRRPPNLPFVWNCWSIYHHFFPSLLPNEKPLHSTVLNEERFWFCCPPTVVLARRPSLSRSYWSVGLGCSCGRRQSPSQEASHWLTADQVSICDLLIGSYRIRYPIHLSHQTGHAIPAATGECLLLPWQSSDDLKPDSGTPTSVGLVITPPPHPPQTHTHTHTLR